MPNNDKKNLIVNYLPSSLSEEDVKKIFERIGELTTCKLIRNKLTGQSLGYGFVEYVHENDAAKAIAEITGLEMDGKRLKVGYAGGGPKSSGGSTDKANENKNNNVYVANLPANVSEDRLLELFSDYGTILSHKLLTNADGSSRGAGFVRFSTAGEAALAIKTLAGEKLSGSVQPLTVKLALPPASKTAQSLSTITSSSLGGLGVASRTLNQRFNPIGGLPHALTTPVINNVGVSPVAAALSGMQAHIAQHGSNLVAAAQVAQQVTPGGIQVQPAQTIATVASVYVFGLQPTHSELTLYELFSPFGAIMNVKMIRDLTKEDRPGKGYGFVNFAKMEEALLAIASMNGQVFEEKILQVSLKQNKNQQQSLVQQQNLAALASNPANQAITVVGSNYIA